MWTSKEYSDFTVIAGDEKEEQDENLKKFAVHKIILTSQSPVFAAMFDRDMKEKQSGRMFIADFSADVIEEMLKFLYSGEVENDGIAMDLYAIAAKYEIGILMTRAEKIISPQVDEANAIEIYGLGHHHNSNVLKHAAFKAIKEMFPEAKFKESLINKPEALKKIVDLCRKMEEVQAEMKSTLKEFEAAD